MKIRRFREEDLPRRVEIANACYPDWPEGVENARHKRDLLPVEDYRQEFVALEGAEVTGFGRLESLGHYCAEPGAFELEAAVHPERRGKGRGRALLDLLLRHLDYLDWRKVLSGCPDEGGPGWGMLERRGFVHETTYICSKLELDNYRPPADRDAVMARFHERGYAMTTYGALDDPDKERKLWELYEEVNRDMPGPVEYKMAGLAEWRKRMASPAHRLDEVLLALAGDEPVGLTELCFPSGPDGPAVIENTGTRRDHRGRGVATALKYASVERALAAGVISIITGNEKDNGAILKIIGKLGFRPTVPWLSYTRRRPDGPA
mgnify:CR=1 FL=1